MKREQPSSYYPVFLNISGKRCVVVGGGQVALRKVRALLEHRANIEVISPDLCSELSQLAESGEILDSRDVAGHVFSYQISYPCLFEFFSAEESYIIYETSFTRHFIGYLLARFFGVAMDHSEEVILPQRVGLPLVAMTHLP